MIITIRTLFATSCAEAIARFGFRMDLRSAQVRAYDDRA